LTQIQNLTLFALLTPSTNYHVARKSGGRPGRVEKYKGTPNHSHSLDESDMRKRSKHIKDMVANEAVKEYKPPMIANAVRKEITKLHEFSGVEYLKTQEVTNIKLKLVGPMNSHLIGDANLNVDIQNANKFLIEKNYQVEWFNVQKSSYQGLCFANLEQLKKLVQYGWLTLIDSTHNTNKHYWRLFTLYVRDGCGSWNVGAHFFVSNENSVVVSVALKIIRKFVPRWRPRYILLDQSSIEANSILITFPGLSIGEQECEVILCTVHVVRTWIRNIYHGPTLNTMIRAMHKKTQIGCEALLQDAITNCPLQANAKYISRNYLKDSKKWALWARQHSPLLLQVTSTNPLESYHSELKSRTSVLHGLIGR